MTQLDIFAASGAALKNAGLALAAESAGPWKTIVLAEFAAWLAVRRAMGQTTIVIEDFRAEAQSHPQSHKAWGTLPRIAASAGLVEPVLDADGNPVYRQARSAKTHAHPVRLWRIV